MRLGQSYIYAGVSRERSMDEGMKTIRWTTGSSDRRLKLCLEESDPAGGAVVLGDVFVVRDPRRLLRRVAPRTVDRGALLVIPIQVHLDPSCLADWIQCKLAPLEGYHSEFQLPVKAISLAFVCKAEVLESLKNLFVRESESE